MSPEVQNRGISGLTNGHVSNKNLKKKGIRSFMLHFTIFHNVSIYIYVQFRLKLVHVMGKTRLCVFLFCCKDNTIREPITRRVSQSVTRWSSSRTIGHLLVILKDDCYGNDKDFRVVNKFRNSFRRILCNGDCEDVYLKFLFYFCCLELKLKIKTSNLFHY